MWAALVTPHESATRCRSRGTEREFGRAKGRRSDMSTMFP